MLDVFAQAGAGWAILELSREVAERAEGPFPVEPVRTLDALHLASALLLRQALPDLRILSKRSDVPEWLQRNAEIATDYLERGPQVVFERIRSHDHNNVLFSCRLAWRIGSKDAHAALRQCADQAPDGDCRQTCHRFKEALETEWSLHDPPYWNVRLPY